MKDPEYSLDVICFVFGVGDGRIRQLVKLGMPKNDRNKYPLAACVQWYIKDLRKKSREGGDKTKKLNERLLQAKVQKEEMKVKQETGEWIELDNVERQGFEAGKQVKESMKSMVEQLSNNLAAENDVFRIKQLLTKHINRTLEDLSKSLKINTK